MKFFNTEQVIAMGERIRDASTKSGLTQRQVADELGITKKYHLLTILFRKCRINY